MINMRKLPVFACLLNLVLVGVGYMYLGQFGKGALILLIAVALGMLGLGILIIPLTIWAMYDAYQVAKKLNRFLKKGMQRTTPE